HAMPIAPVVMYASSNVVSDKATTPRWLSWSWSTVPWTKKTKTTTESPTVDSACICLEWLQHKKSRHEPAFLWELTAIRLEPFSCFSVHTLLSKMCSGKARGVKFGHSK